MSHESSFDVDQICDLAMKVFLSQLFRSNLRIRKIWRYDCVEMLYKNSLGLGEKSLKRGFIAKVHLPMPKFLRLPLPHFQSVNSNRNLSKSRYEETLSVMITPKFNHQEGEMDKPGGMWDYLHDLPRAPWRVGSKPEMNCPGCRLRQRCIPGEEAEAPRDFRCNQHRR